MASSEKLDKTTRDGLVKVLSEIADRYGYRALSKRTGIPVSSIENHVRGVSPPSWQPWTPTPGFGVPGLRRTTCSPIYAGKAPPLKS